MAITSKKATVLVTLPLSVLVLLIVYAVRSDYIFPTTFPIITLDGASAVGKSPVAALLRTEYNVLHVEQGKYFRAITYIGDTLNISASDKNARALIDIFNRDCSEVVIDNGVELSCNGTVYTEKNLRSPAVNAVVAKYSEIGEIRDYVRSKVRACIGLARARKNTGLLCDGRVCGSVVFPHANVKLFFTASLDSRIKRRIKDEGETDDLVTRDSIDKNRDHDPFVKPEGAFEISTTGLPYEQLVDKVKSILVSQRLFIRKGVRL